MTLRITDQGLHCPVCDEPYGLHLDAVSVAGRAEDGPFTTVRVDALGDVTSGADVPKGDQVGEGRRHRIALEGWCEFGLHRFAIVFSQHKGQTSVEVVPMPAKPEDAVLLAD